MNVDDITTIVATSPSDLIDLGESFKFVPNKPIVSWAFRGQPRKFGNLAPSFQRIFAKKNSSLAARIIEEELIKAFRDHYTTLQNLQQGMPVAHLIEEGSELMCLSVMQHYGVPTRLLDWTSDFWKAVYFACVSDPNEDAELWFYNQAIFSGKVIQKDGTLIQSDGSNLPMSLQGGNQIFELKAWTTPRMADQSAHHTVSFDVLADHSPLIFDLAQMTPTAANGSDGFRRVVISGGCKEKTVGFLDKFKNINASRLFPDVEGLSRFLRWQLDTLVTMML